MRRINLKIIVYATKICEDAAQGLNASQYIQTIIYTNNATVSFFGGLK